MNLRKLGRTQIDVSPLGFGCGPTAGLMISGTARDRRDAIARALELGINYFDTAPIYGNTVSESNLGEALADLGAKPIIATKVALAESDTSDIYGAVIRSVEASLERLRVARLPLVQLHNRVGAQRAPKSDIGVGAQLTVDDVLACEGVVAALRNLRSRGLVEFFGCCAFGGEPEALRVLVDSGEFDTMLVHYSVLNTSALSKTQPGTRIRDYGQVAARAAAADMGTIALRVLEGGMLSGAGGHHPLAARVGAPDGATAARARAACDFWKRAALEPVEAALRFVLSNPEIATMLVGFSDITQIEDAVRYCERGSLPPPIIATIEEWRARDFVG